VFGFGVRGGYAMVSPGMNELLLDILKRANGTTGYHLSEVAANVTFNERERELLLESHLSAFLFPLSQKENSVAIPEAIQKIAFKCYYENIGVNTLLLNALKEIAQACQTQNIRIVPLKGADLLLNVYENIGLRQLSDLDVLIEKSDLEKFRKVMLELGFVETPMLPRKAAVLVDHPSPYLYIRNGLHVDIHLKLNKKKQFDLNIEVIWNRVTQTNFENVVIWRLENIDFLIHLCVHLHKHFIVFNHKSIHFLDIKLFIQKNEIQLQDLLSRAQEYGCAIEVEQIIHLLDVFGIQNFSEKKITYNISELERQQLEKNFLMSLQELKLELSKHAHEESYFRIPQLSKKRQLQYLIYFLFPERDFFRGGNARKGVPLFALYFSRLVELTGNILKARFSYFKKLFLK
jgi:hypothetical protein